MIRGRAVRSTHHVYPSDVSFPSACRHILNDHRAIFNAGTAARAAVFNNRAGTLSDFDLEVSGRTLHTFKVCVGDQFDI
jgi:hypothetical protein